MTTAVIIENIRLVRGTFYTRFHYQFLKRFGIASWYRLSIKTNTELSGGQYTLHINICVLQLVPCFRFYTTLSRETNLVAGSFQYDNPLPGF